MPRRASMRASTAALSTPTPESGLASYLAQIRRFPLLEPQEEHMLAKRWREHGDRDAAHRLVTSHLRARLRPADCRGDLGRQRGPDAGGQALLSGKRLSPRHLRHVVDQGLDPGIRPALVVAGE